MEHDIITVQGKEYKAVASGMTCKNCAFTKGLRKCNEIPCAVSQRKDGKSAKYKLHINASKMANLIKDKI